MRIFNNLKHLTAICLRFEERLFTSLTMLGLESKASISSTIKENSRFKGALSGLRRFLATEGTLKRMKNAFYLFHLKSSFRSQDI